MIYSPASSKRTGKNLSENAKRERSKFTSGTVSYAPPNSIVMRLMKSANREAYRPVCPLTPLAAPVAVKRTIASCMT